MADEAEVGPADAFAEDAAQLPSQPIPTPTLIKRAQERAQERAQARREAVQEASTGKEATKKTGRLRRAVALFGDGFRTLFRG